MAPADDGPEIGFTGARFGGQPRKRRKKRGDRVEPGVPRLGAAEADTVAFEVVEPATPAPVSLSSVPPAPVGSDDDAGVGYTGARFGGATRRRRDAEESSAPAPATPEPALPALAPAEEYTPEYAEDGTGHSLAVRPYFYTRGRTRSRYELAIETLVSTPAAAFERLELREHLPILETCREPRSIAEIGALLGMPLGVARVVIGDLAVTGALEVHSTVAAEGPDVALMERVLAGLRKL